MKLAYKFLDVENHQAISEEVYRYIIDHTDAILNKNYFNDQSIHHMLSHCPLLVEFLNSRHLVPKRLATIVCANKDTLTIHKDSDGVDSYVRILWPVRNCQGSKTKIWRVPDGAGTLASDTNGILYTEFPINQERELIHEFELVSPVLFDASCVHSVHPDPELSGHRISFTIGFDRDLPISKSIKAWFGFQR
jgi:hypothetical protein